MKAIGALHNRLYRRIGHLFRELAKFGVVGGVAFVVDMGGFNLLRYGLSGEGPLHHKPLTARALSLLLATVVAYLGNRHWTWRHRERRAVYHEYALFAGLNLAGLVINLAILALVNYVFELRDPVSNNIANLVGIGLGTTFRFWSYRRFVFRAPRPPVPLEPPAPSELTEPPEPVEAAPPAGGKVSSPV